MSSVNHSAESGIASSRPALDALPDRLRLPFKVDAAPLAAELNHLRVQRWTPHFVPQHFDGEWDVLPLRAPAGAVHPILQIASNSGSSEWVSTPYLDRAPAIAAFLSSLPCMFGAVRLMALAPGSVIHPHRDDDLNAAWGMARLHIPLITNAQVDFRLNGRRVQMRVGECWYLRLSDSHSVRNDGAAARVHLVVDAVVNDWLEQQLLAGAGAEKTLVPKD